MKKKIGKIVALFMAAGLLVNSFSGLRRMKVIMGP